MKKFNAQKLKNARKEKGLSYGKFNEQIKEFCPKSSKALMWNWENGGSPSTRYLFAICKVLGKSPEYFYDSQ